MGLQSPSNGYVYILLAQAELKKPGFKLLTYYLPRNIT